MKNLLAESEGFNPTINYEAKIHWISYVIPVFFIIIGSVGVISFLLLGYKYMLGLVGIISLFLIYLFIRGLLRLLKNRSTKKHSRIIIRNALLKRFSADTTDVCLVCSDRIGFRKSSCTINNNL